VRTQWLGVTAAMLGLMVLLSASNPVLAMTAPLSNSPCNDARAWCYTDSQGNRFCGYPGQSSVLCSRSTDRQTRVMEVWYLVHIQFYSYGSLDSVQVSLYDERGGFRGGAASQDGDEVTISFLTSNPPRTLNAKAAGQVSIGDYWQWFATGSSTIYVGDAAGGEYWTSVEMF
jgi:hypothetical protein